MADRFFERYFTILATYIHNAKSCIKVKNIKRQQTQLNFVCHMSLFIAHLLNWPTPGILLFLVWNRATFIHQPINFNFRLILALCIELTKSTKYTRTIIQVLSSSPSSWVIKLDQNCIAVLFGHFLMVIRCFNISTFCTAMAIVCT